MKIIYTLSFCVLSFCSFGQDTLIFKHNYDDGYQDKSKIKTRTFQVIVNTVSGDSIKRRNTWAGIGIASEGLVCFGGTSYYIPKKHLFNLKYGTGIHYDGVMPIFNWERNYNLKQSIGEEASGTTIFIAEIPAKQRFSIGVHYGFGDNNLVNINNFRASHIKGGLTLLRAKFGDVLLSSNYKKRVGGRLVTLNIDAVKYFHNPKQYITNPQQTEEEYLSEIEEAKNDLGVSLNLEGYASIWSKKGVFGFKWIIGAGIPPYSYMPWYQFGLGLSFSF